MMGRRPSAVATLVERSSRYVRLVALPHGIKAIPVRIALVNDLNQIEDGMCKTLTWDRGREMADHVALTEETGCRVYFCDARSPWQRGTNEIRTAYFASISTRTATSESTIKPH